MTRRRWLIGVAAAFLLPWVAAACGGSSGSGSQASTPSANPNATVSAVSSSLGTILADKTGRTLYLFEQDSGRKSACTGACAAGWPPLTASGTPTAGSGINAGMLATITRADGKSQVTYNGHPLYTFAGDSKPGDTKGEGANAFGARWFAVSSDGSAIQKKPNGASGY